MSLEQARGFLKEKFGYDTFRKGQEEAIQGIIEGKDTVVIMPTGSGKSICYQIPALVFEGLTIVISPLIALMKDQVDSLVETGIPATYLNSTLDQYDIMERLYELKKGTYKILYIAPERMDSSDIRDLISTVKVPFVAIDEAHCISQWGHDFRPSYKRIAAMINSFKERPVIAALTATATEMVQQDIRQLLGLTNPAMILTGYNRDNLFFGLEKDVDKIKYVTAYIKKHSEDVGIVYCSTRKDVDKVHLTLQKQGIEATKYHAGLSDSERAEHQQDFIFDRKPVIVATNAFGMGIDKSNVRYVIHYNMPGSIEAYYQEAGRAGRDGLPSECILLYHPGDVRTQKFFFEELEQISEEQRGRRYEKLKGMVDYCHTSSCLRSYILQYFGENEIEKCDQCSLCTEEAELVDVTTDAQKVFACIYRMEQRFGVQMVASVLTGSKNKKVLQFAFDRLSTYGIMKEYALKPLQDFIHFLIAEDYLYLTREQYPVVRLKETAVSVLKGKETVMRRVVKKKVIESVAEHNEQAFLFLRDLRKELAEERQVAPYVIFHDVALKEMASYLPETEEEMMEVKGMGQAKYQKYGQVFLRGLKDLLDKNPELREKKQIREVVVTTTQNQGEKKSGTKTHLVSYELFEKGTSIEDIATQRNIKPLTVESHIFRCLEEGYELDLNQFIPEGEEELIRQTILEVGGDFLRPFKDALPEEISYRAIRAVKHKMDCE